jgi:putative peptidoglycan lipid II flippase
LGVAAVQINFLLNTILASAQSVGSVTAISTAWMVMTMPQVVIAQAIAIAAMPTFSAQAALGQKDALRASLAATLRGVIYLALPASLGLIWLRKPIVALLFQHGMFDANSTALVDWALLWYATGLVAHSLVEVLARAFYSLHDTKTPVFVGVAAMSLNLVFSLAFTDLFARIGWMPHGGLALANSLATALEMTGLLVLMRRKLNGLSGRSIVLGFSQAVTATLGMSLILGLWLNQTPEQPEWLVAIVGVPLGGAIYALGILALGVQEARGLVNGLLHFHRNQIN